MSPLFTRDEMRERLRAQDIGEEAIERVLAREFYGEPGPTNLGTATYVHVDFSKRLDFPIRLILPWSALCSDNTHERAAIMRTKLGKLSPRKVMDPRYRAARDKTRVIAKQAMGEFPPLLMPLSLHARVYLPGGSARNDAINFSKCANDALQGIIFKNDNQLHDQRWIRAGIDVDQPRAEISIAPL